MNVTESRFKNRQLHMEDYNSNGNRGVAAGLGNIQKLKDGEALSSRTNAEDDFEAVEDEDFLG